MSVPEQVPYKEYRATGSNNSFEITFYLPDPKDLVVMVNKEIPPVGAYSVQGNTVVFNTAPNEGDLVELTRDTQLDRETNFKSYDNSFRPETINFDLDKIWLVLQESNLVDAKILARLKQEIEWRRTHDFNYDELAQVREKQLFDALKGYTDTLLASTNPGVFQGVIAGVVFARDGKSIQTHIEEILNNLELNRSYIDEQVGLMAPQATTYNKVEVDTKINAEATRAQVAEQVLQDQVNAVGVGNKAYLTYAEMDADKANNPINSKLEVTNDPDPTKNGTYQWDGTTLTKSAYDPLTQSKGYTDDQIALIPIEQINLADYSAVLKDKNGLLAVGFMLDKNGKPSIYMLNSIFEGLVDRIAEKAVLAIADMGIELKQTSDGACFLVDKNQQLSWWGVDSDGGIPEYTKKCILDLIDDSGFSLVPSSVKSTYQETEIKAVSGPDIDCVGDSLTNGAGGGGVRYPLVLQDLLITHNSTAIVRNSGVGGETSPTITARVGGYPFVVRVDDGLVPATTTAVRITLDQINGQTARPLLQGGGGSDFTGTLAGVDGKISLVQPNGASTTWDDANYYTFKRTNVGSDVVANRPIPFVTDYAKKRMGDIKIIWIGQNGPSTERAIQDAKAIIQSMRALDKRYLVISKPTATPADDAAFFAEFGDRFIAAKKYMVEFGIHDALELGLVTEVTAQDLTDISNYTIPLPLCASTSDRLHWSAAGYTVFAHLIFKKLQFLGWI